MSAFIVHEDHINALVSYAKAKKCLGDWSAQQWTTELYQENVKSIEYKYPSDKGKYPKDIAFQMDDYAASQLTAINILKMVACYEYQTGEHQEWETSAAYEMCQRLKNYAVRNLPGYEEAVYEYRKCPPLKANSQLRAIA